MLRAPSRSPVAHLIASVLIVALVAASLPVNATASIPERETSSLTKTAFGELIAHTGTDPQPYAFAGEPYDPNSGFQYHRARWMDPRVGRFLGMDPLAGNQFDPPSLHKYLYAGSDPANRIDPTGLEFTLASLTTVSGILNVVNAISTSLTVGTISFQATTIAYRLSTDDGYELDDALEDARKAGTTAAIHALLNFAAPLAAGRIISQLGALGLIRLGNVSRANGLLAEHLVANANGLWNALRKVPLPTGGIPEFVTRTALHEVKNGARLLWSNHKLRGQLVEYATYCAQTGKEMVLHVRPGAQVGSNLISNLNQILQRSGGRPLNLIRDIPDYLRVVP